MIRYFKLVIILIFFQSSHLINIYKGQANNINGKSVRIILLAFKSLPRIYDSRYVECLTSDLFLAVVGELIKWLRRAYNPYTYKNSAFL